MNNDYNALATALKGRVWADAPMKKYTTWKIGGPADFLAEPVDAEDIVAVLDHVREEELPCFVCGNGSNLLVRDGGIDGVVLRIGEAMSAWTAEENGDEVVVTAQSGLLLTKLARETARRGWQGLEWAAGIPASLGGAATMNAGAYGHYFYEVLTGAEIVTKEGEIRFLDGAELGHGYRSTALMDSGAIVTKVWLTLKKGDAKALNDFVEETMAKRKAAQPLDKPSAGSVFKNPDGSHAGYLIEQTGLRGLRVGDAQVSEKHGNFILNLGNATAEDVLTLIELVQKEVREKQGYELEPEILVVGRAK